MEQIIVILELELWWGKVANSGNRWEAVDSKPLSTLSHVCLCEPRSDLLGQGGARSGFEEPGDDSVAVAPDRRGRIFSDARPDKHLPAGDAASGVPSRG